MHQIWSLKFLRSDGYRTYFYHTYWAIIRLKVCNAILNYFQWGQYDKLYKFHFWSWYPRERTTKLWLFRWVTISQWKGKDYHMAIKMHMSKAYNSMEWPFFGGYNAEIWVWYHMDKVDNGVHFNSIICRPLLVVNLENGLSPYLLLLCVVGLSSLINKWMVGEILRASM